MKVLCYGVREVEKPFFEKINQDYGYELSFTEQFLNSGESARLAKGFDALILRANCFANKERLELFKSYGICCVLTRTVGYNHIDLAAAKELGIKTAYVPSYSPNAIAELSLSLALMLLRHTAYTANNTRQGNFSVDPFMFSKELRNCTVGIIGLGRIGQVAAQIYRGVGARVLGYDVIQKEGIEAYAKQTGLEEILAESDIVSLHMPYVPASNKGMVNKAFLAQMKEGAILINTARGELQNLKDIIEALHSGRLAGFGVDTIEGEADFFFKNLQGQDIKNPELKALMELYPRVLITPHIGSYTDEALSNMIETTYKNLQQIAAGQECPNALS